MLLSVFKIFVFMTSVLSASPEEDFLASISFDDFPRAVYQKLNETSLCRARAEEKYRVPKGISGIDLDLNPGITYLQFTCEIAPSEALLKFLRKPLTPGCDAWVIDNRMGSVVYSNLWHLKHLGAERYNYIVGKQPSKLLSFVTTTLSAHSALNGSTSNIIMSPAIHATEPGISGYIRSDLEDYRSFFARNGCSINFELMGFDSHGLHAVTCGKNDQGEMTFMSLSSIFKRGPRTKSEIYDFFMISFALSPIPDEAETNRELSEISISISKKWNKVASKGLGEMSSYIPHFDALQLLGSPSNTSMRHRLDDKLLKQIDGLMSKQS